MNNSASQTDHRVTFSVIIPTYNAEKTISRALQSVIGQSYTALEIIIVDDASTDNTCAIISNCDDQKINLVRKQTNTGSSDTRNIGMNIARSNFIAFLDADDIWHRDKLMIIQQAITEHPDGYVFAHPYTLADIKDKPVPQKFVFNKLSFLKQLPSNKIATSCAVIKNDPSFRFETDMRYTEDFDLWLRIAYRHSTYFSEIALTQVFRPFLSKGGVSENKWQMRKGEIKTYTRLLKLNPLFILGLPFLCAFSLAKHLYKLVNN